MSDCCLTCGPGIAGIIVDAPLTGVVDPLTGILHISALSSTITPPTTVPATPGELILKTSSAGFTVLSFDRARFKNEVYDAIEVVGLTKVQDVNGDTILGGANYNITGTPTRIAVTPIAGGLQADFVNGGIYDVMLSGLNLFGGFLSWTQPGGPGTGLRGTVNQSSFDDSIRYSLAEFDTRWLNAIDVPNSNLAGITVFGAPGATKTISLFPGDYLTQRVFGAFDYTAVDNDVDIQLTGAPASLIKIKFAPAPFRNFVRDSFDSLSPAYVAQLSGPGGTVQIGIKRATSADGSITVVQPSDFSTPDLAVSIPKSRDRLVGNIQPAVGSMLTVTQSAAGAVVQIDKTPDLIFTAYAPLIHSQAYTPGQTFSMPISIMSFSRIVEGQITLDMVVTESVVNPANAWTMEILRKGGPTGGPYTTSIVELTHGGPALSAAGVVLAPLPTGLGHISKTVFDVISDPTKEYQYEAHFRLDATVGVASTLTVVGSVGVPVSVARTRFRSL